MSSPTADALRNIGFSATVKRGERVLHVQTEVLGQEQLFVKCTVLESGAVRFSRSEQWPAHLRQLPDIESYVRARHDEVIQQLNQGAFG